MSFICDEQIAKLFPLKSISDVVQLFRVHLENAKEPDLTLLSIVTGMIENTLTRKCPVNSSSNSDGNNVDSSDIDTTDNNTSKATTTTTTTTAATTTTSTTSTTTASDASSTVNNFPIVHLESVQELYDKLIKVISLVGEYKRIGGEGKVTKSGRLSVNHHKNGSQFATREVIKQCSDVIWNSLIRSTYKDRAHLQSLYSYLDGNKLDCFGVAFAVVAGCQLLGYSDVHLAISEDHAWVVFGKTGDDTIEVTWHGKGAEDKRGQSVSQGCESHSWLYLNGNPVVCDRYIEVAAIVSSINPSLSMTSACLEVADLQQQLLWLLFDMSHLQRYPMGLGCLGELEEVSATQTRPTCSDIFKMAVEAAQINYKNHHVYPYTYQGGYYYRQKMYKEAFASWANAGDVIRLYNYSRDDEEIYKEFSDIANELIPNVMKTESSGHSAKSVLRDPHCFAHLLRFYDGICRWEEGSQTPILHIGWAKPLVTTISRFDGDIRSQVIIHCANDDDEVNGSSTPTSRSESNNNDISLAGSHEDEKKTKDNESTEKDKNGATEIKDDDSPTTVRTTLVEALTAACGEKILNPDYLLQGGGQPFTDQQTNESTICDDKNEEKLLLLTQSASPKDGELNTEKSVTSATTTTFATNEGEIKVEKEVNKDVKEEKNKENSNDTSSTSVSGPVYKETVLDDSLMPKRPEITLYSQKMKGLKELLLGEKLNTHAISLQVTAQSQVQIGGKKSRHAVGSVNYATGIKRSRRD